MLERLTGAYPELLVLRGLQHRNLHCASIAVI